MVPDRQMCLPVVSMLECVILPREWETLFSCPYTFKFWTRPLTGTASGMASVSVQGRNFTFWQ